MSSHSDSELKVDTKYKTKKNLNVGLKAKQRMYGNDTLKVHALRAILNDRTPDINSRRLIAAASTNNTPAVYHLLQAGISPNLVDKQQRSALHLAVSKGYVDVVRILLQFGADLNAQDIVGNTPLHLAACTTNIEIITQLLNAGADVHSLDMHGRNPLQLAQSKLQILRQSWYSGIIEMVQLRDQLQQIIDIMISLRRNRKSAFTKTAVSPSETNVIDLEMLKLSINSGPEEEVDAQMTRLLEELEGFSLK